MIGISHGRVWDDKSEDGCDAREGNGGLISGAQLGEGRA
jgi:hypothetical protein